MIGGTTRLRVLASRAAWQRGFHRGECQGQVDGYLRGRHDANPNDPWVIQRWSD